MPRPLHPNSLIIVLIGLLATVSSAWAEKSVADVGKPVLLLGGLEGLSWDASSAEVIKFYEKRLWDTYGKDKKTISDPLAIDNLRKKTQSRIAEMKKGYLEFAADSKGYWVSIIDREFKRGTNEAVLRYDSDEAQRYYFFIQDKLWKLVIAFNGRAIAEQNLETLQRTMEARYGALAPLPEGSEAPAGLVRWADDVTELLLEDRQDPWGTFSLSFISRDMASRVAEMRGDISAYAPGGKQEDSNALLDDIMTSSDDDEDANIIDEITGAEPGTTPADKKKGQAQKGKKAQPAGEELAPGRAAGAKPEGDSPIIY